MKKVYLDNAATTRIYSEVVDIMSKSLREDYENPSSMYDGGIKNKKTINVCRANIAKNIKANTNEIFLHQMEVKQTIGL